MGRNNQIFRRPFQVQGFKRYLETFVRERKKNYSLQGNRNLGVQIKRLPYLINKEWSWYRISVSDIFVTT